ncbi:MAG: hypothetical protein A3H98_09535 [Bacteroidetes bacterium RIFCSPLOWO2_02_FULL_36_8]|nr:MAG: hypothetical protein A3H98_09535 [Bacteroidetes bacterium RIFCSPLOWO2_02_FULL_36_8]
MKVKKLKRQKNQKRMIDYLIWLTNGPFNVLYFPLIFLKVKRPSVILPKVFFCDVIVQCQQNKPLIVQEKK